VIAVDLRDPLYDIAAPPEREVDVLRRAVTLLQRRLPTSWSINLREEVPIGGRRVDGMAELSAPGQMAATLVFEAKRSVATAHLPSILDQLKESAPSVDNQEASVVPVIVARYLGSGARSWLERHGVSYADATGNIYLSIDRPAIFLRDRGADRDPWRGPGRPRGTLTGPAAARVVRALVDYAPPMTVPKLIGRSGVSTGAAYRVVGFLEQEALITREPKGPIKTVEWRRTLERWSQDYGFQASNTVGPYLEPRGLSTLADRLAQSKGFRYAVTGSMAVQRLAPYAPPRLAMIYVDDMSHAAEELGLRRVETGANVLLASGDYDVVFDRAVTDDGLTYVAPSQAAVDLLTGPGRSPAEAQAVLDWMETHEGEWRQ
jgi:hypothetical protein